MKFNSVTEKSFVNGILKAKIEKIGINFDQINVISLMWPYAIICVILCYFLNVTLCYYDKNVPTPTHL